ncbi:DUF4369 domain-containing protein [Marinifilum caeruleilacunae]|uniref:DUF4369 domain-containing protein n=1 Tax=Marinifilum caeruleilacunae TaxID=2499076 RepID=A0ABX1X134_9BACT|nr:DUF4369 domain-containing protein [Marinifilum caeruleilacunae]NOU62080.1 DUF4369 domain-containing protein [Marinifilum caeruleilacunae]
MKNLFKGTLAFVMALVLFSSCEEKKVNELVLAGEISNYQNGMIEVSFGHDTEHVKVDVIDGKFSYQKQLKEPIEVALNIPQENPDMMRGNPRYIRFYVDNGNVNVKLNGDDFGKNPVIEGSSVYDDSKKYEDEIKRRYPEDPYAIYRKMSPLYGKTDQESIAKLKALQEEAAEVREKHWTATLETEEWFIDNYPNSYFSAVLVSQRNSGKRGGKKLHEVKAEVARLSSEIQATPIVKRLLARNESVAKTDKSLKEIMKDASNVSYKRDDSFKGSQFKGIKYLASFSNGNLCSIDNKGIVGIISPEGNLIRNIQVAAKGPKNAVAVGPDDKIYIPSAVMGVEKAKFRGRMVERQVVKKVEVYVFNEAGKQLEKFELKGMTNLFGLKVDAGYIAASDYDQRLIRLYNLETKEEVTAIENLRPCCLMLDFDINNKQQVVVANLASFRTHIYDFKGKLQATFGQRGKTLDDFHGCCNPVNVASLSNGAIVTVEKDPTRIKIFSKEGAKQIEGIEELVKGCAYIPMTVDKKENIYLASPEKGLVRCVAI